MISSILAKTKNIGQPYPPYQWQLLFTPHYQNLLHDFDQAIDALPQ
jgi:hypothetical protein